MIKSVPTASHYSCTFRPSTATHLCPTQKHRLSRRDALSWNAAARFRFICLISVFFWLPRAIKRHSSVPKQTLHWCTSRFFIFLHILYFCLADNFFFWVIYLFFFNQMMFSSKPSDSPLITWTRLLVMGINLGLTFLSVSDSFIFCIRSRKVRQLEHHSSKRP